MLHANAKARSLDLTKAQSGLYQLDEYSGTPDSQGVLETFDLTVPAFERGAYYRGTWWPYGGNRVQPQMITRPEGEEGGLFLLLKVGANDYLAVLPLCGDQAWAWLAPTRGRFELKLGTRGPDAVDGNLPVVAWARANAPYAACHQVWQMVCRHPLFQPWIKLREQKSYPEMFKYLGWCSWEGYHHGISEENMVAEMTGLTASPVPVRYILVDDGHFDPASLAPDATKFPHGYKPLTDLRSETGIRWVGMWHALLGNARAMALNQPAAILDAMMRAPNGRMVPKPNAKSIETFLRYMMRDSAQDEIDFIKMDFIGTLLPVYAGSLQELPLAPFPKTDEHAIGNPSQATTLYARIYQKIAAETFHGLMNCNWLVPHFIFNSGDSVVGRCSSDYKLGDLEKAKAHLFESYTAMPWLGQIAWGDQDMFHSSDPVAGRMMAVSKAISGGPVYLSDHYDKLVPAVIRPLCYQDGLLLRPLAPASPLPEDLFQPLNAPALLRVAAPLANHCAAILFYNLNGPAPGKGPTFSKPLSPADYQSAAGLLQPFPGPWPLPKEGLIAYDWTTAKAWKLETETNITITGFGDRLFQLSPIHDGWSVIGRTDKYLPAAAVEAIHFTAGQLYIRLHEQGPFAIWLQTGKPVADKITFRALGGGLFQADLPIRSQPVAFIIERHTD